MSLAATPPASSASREVTSPGARAISWAAITGQSGSASRTLAYTHDIHAVWPGRMNGPTTAFAPPKTTGR